MIKYQTSKYRYKVFINAVEVERETDTSVWVEGSRSAKRSSMDNYFDTWTEAHQFLLERAEDSVEIRRDHLALAEKELAEIKNLNP